MYGRLSRWELEKMKQQIEIYLKASVAEKKDDDVKRIPNKGAKAPSLPLTSPCLEGRGRKTDLPNKVGGPGVLHQENFDFKSSLRAFFVNSCTTGSTSISFRRAASMWMRDREENLSCPVVDRSHVLTLRMAEKFLSAPAELTGIVMFPPPNRGEDCRITTHTSLHVACIQLHVDMEKYANLEIKDMGLLYGEVKGNARADVRLYHETAKTSQQAPVPLRMKWVCHIPLYGLLRTRCRHWDQQISLLDIKFCSVFCNSAQ
ncbi:hypothetical protein PR048_028959 [Dryococelus australis]|uniref:Uncharacterized protein n=1 Tax=Dryococelus australis TaxID=614101 RepID=A0ABQ9GC17_9NEOP|nr:hypothetical protein PR048_028959 [Dryococelus australis]